ncbi:uncharacterized protein LOC121665567 [Corvus kubaryi]|uniref:uncharacterized protein LOC121665567 n=1 Tax=Corvus kubaryi TaxID=68294 RepID=UPI001C055C9F|nr:uncharacterized protein LOC121665567 [Corvus kubaryi]
MRGAVAPGYSFLRTAVDESSTSTLCANRLSHLGKEPVSRQQGQKERPPPWFPPSRRGEQGGGGGGGWEPPPPGAALEAQSPSHRSVSRAGAVGITADSCLGAGEGFQGSLLLDLAGKPGGKFLAARGRCGRELGTAGRGARRSHTSPPQRFRAGLLLILPPFPITDIRQYKIRSATSYSASTPMPAAQRINSFSLKPTPPKRTPTKTKLNKTPTKNNQTKNITDYSLGLLSPLRHTVKEISVYAHIETCRETPHIVVFLLPCPGNKINHQNRSWSSSEMFSTGQNECVLLEALFGSSSVSCVSTLSCGGAAPFLLASWQPLALPFETAFLAIYLPDRIV